MIAMFPCRSWAMQSTTRMPSQTGGVPLSVPVEWLLTTLASVSFRNARMMCREKVSRFEYALGRSYPPAGGEVSLFDSPAPDGTVFLFIARRGRTSHRALGE